MNNIFLSYRREDTLPYCDTLDRALVSYFGREHVFRDVMRMVPGQDWKSQLWQAIEQSAVQLALIGPQWLQPAAPAGHRRIDDPMDPVRTEIELARQRGIQIIPILVEKTVMPDARKLPPSIAFLAGLQALSLRSGLDTAPDIQRIILQILALAPQTTPHFDAQGVLARAEQQNISPDWRVWRSKFGTKSILVLTPNGVVQGRGKMFSAIDFSSIQHLDMATRTKTFRRGIYIGPIGILGSPWPEVKTHVVLPLILRNGKTFDWTIGRQFPDHAAIAQAIKVTYDRFVMSRQGVGLPPIGIPLAHNTPAYSSSAASTATTAYAISPAPGYGGSPVAIQTNSGATPKPTVGASWFLGLATVGTLLLYTLFGANVVGDQFYQAWWGGVVLMGIFLAGFTATLWTRRLTASTLTGCVIGVGGAIYVVIASPTSYGNFLQMFLGTALLIIVVAFIGGLLALFVNLFRH